MSNFENLCSASVDRRRGVSKFQFANEETKRPRKHTQSTALQTPERRSTDAQRFNLFGKRVIMEENQAQIDIAGLMSGVYILTLRHNGNIYTNKIIIE